MKDNRGSVHQKRIYELLLDIYPQYNIVYEQEIKEIGLRFDIFIPELGIAIEYDGQQHFKYIEHFHSDINGYILANKNDKIKNAFCDENAIKLIRLSGNWLDKDKEELLHIIKETPYPEGVYNKMCVR